ncbi:hypothetical protein B0H14DRAFT_2620373 [Mycena olivaceomarginata]|nr:hypothetical protein B0H14DRAFT_2620373 [Mycena olivaceomarginata]
MVCEATRSPPCIAVNPLNHLLTATLPHPPRMDSSDETRHRTAAATLRPLPIHTTPPCLPLVGATDKTCRPRNHLLTATLPHLPHMDASDETRHHAAAATPWPLPVHATPPRLPLVGTTDKTCRRHTAATLRPVVMDPPNHLIATTPPHLPLVDTNDKIRTRHPPCRSDSTSSSRSRHTCSPCHSASRGRKPYPPQRYAMSRPPDVVPLSPQESDLSHQSDHFEVGQAAEEKARTWKKSLGMPVALAVEELDQEDEEEFGKEVAEHRFNDTPTPTKKSKKLKAKAKAKGKGKGKATQPTSGFQSDDCLVDGDEVEEEEDRNSDGKGYTRGPIPDDIKELLYQAHDKLTAAVDNPVKHCGKSSTTLHEELGTIIRTGRAPSAWNVWQQYFGELIPKDIAALRDNNKIRAKLKSELKPVTQLAALLLSTYNVHMWGYLIDPDGQASFVFGAGEDFKEMRRLQHHNLNQQVKDQEHIFGTIEMRKRGLEALQIPIPNLDAQDGETMRDAYQRQFTSIVAGQLWTLSGQDLDKTRFQMRWGVKIIDAAREALHDANQIIGSVAFALKKIKSATFETFMDELVKANTSSSTSDDNNIMHLVCWNDDERQLPLDEQGEIPVVIDGFAEGFASDVKKQAETAKKTARAVQKEVNKARKVKPFKARDGREVENGPDVCAGPSRPPQSERPNERNSHTLSHSPPHHLESSRRPHELEPHARPHSPSLHAEGSRQYYTEPDRHSRTGPSRPYYAEPERDLHAGPSRAHYATPDRDLRAAPYPYYYPEPNRDLPSYSPAPHPEPSRSYYTKPDSCPRSPPPPHAGSSYMYYETNSRPPPSGSYPTYSRHSNQHSRSEFECPTVQSAHDLPRIPDSSVLHVANSCSRSVAVQHNTTLPRIDFVAWERELNRAVQLNSHLKQVRVLLLRAPAPVVIPQLQSYVVSHNLKSEQSNYNKLCMMVGQRVRTGPQNTNGQQPGRIFYATRLRHTDHPSRADAYSFIEEAGHWERMGAKHTPVLATEEDSERYKKDVAILGLEDYPPQHPWSSTVSFEDAISQSKATTGQSDHIPPMVFRERMTGTTAFAIHSLTNDDQNSCFELIANHLLRTRASFKSQAICLGLPLVMALATAVVSTIVDPQANDTLLLNNLNEWGVVATYWCKIDKVKC